MLIKKIGKLALEGLSIRITAVILLNNYVYNEFPGNILIKISFIMFIMYNVYFEFK